jgi:hypothetical protein
MKRWLMWTGVAILILLLCLIPFLHFQNVYAYRSAHTIISRHATFIRNGQVIDDAFVLGHNVQVAGNVNEMIVVIDGDIHLLSTTRADVIVDVGGRVAFDPGAHVNKLIHISLHTPFWNGAVIGIFSALLLWVGTFLVSVGLGLVAVAMAWGLRSDIQTPLQLLEQSVRRAGFAGLLTSVLTLAISGLFAATLFGIPLAVVMAVLYVGMGIIGLSVVAVWVGRLFFRDKMSDRPLWVYALAGVSLLIAFINVPFIGIVLFLMMWMIAVGVSMIWFWKFWIMHRKQGRQVE